MIQDDEGEKLPKSLFGTVTSRHCQKYNTLANDFSRGADLPFMDKSMKGPSHVEKLLGGVVFLNWVWYTFPKRNFCNFFPKL